MQPSTGAPVSCPHCGFSVASDAVECPRCGVVFAKLRLRETAELPSAPTPAIEGTPAARARDIEWWARAALLVALAWWTWNFARLPFALASHSVWHMPDLIFHEAGHMIFMPFGQFMMALGGSLFQCALPIALAIVFIREENRFGALVCLWWAGQNLVDVAPYIADARALQMVLLGGRTGAEVEGHDWEYILTQLGWLHLDRTLGVWTYRTGLLVMMAAIAAGVVTLLSTGRLRPPHHPHTAA